MAHAGAGFDDRNESVVAHHFYKSAAAARYHQIDVADRLKHLSRRFVVGIEERSAVFRKIMFGEHASNKCNCGLVGVDSIRPALEHAGVAAFQAKRENVERHVRASLIDNADNAERHAHLANVHAVRLCPFSKSDA